MIEALQLLVLLLAIVVVAPAALALGIIAAISATLRALFRAPGQRGH